MNAAVRGQLAIVPRTGATGATDEEPFDLVLSALVRSGAKVRSRTVNKARLFCPTHRDAKPSLVVTRCADRVLLKCFAGCRTSELVNAVGLRMADLFAKGSASPQIKPELLVTYDYFDTEGVLIAQKVRLQPKGFRWRRPSRLRPGEWLWGLDGLTPGLYRLCDIQGADRVFCVEGEKAADRLHDLGLRACCPPSGAARWVAEWTLDLRKAGCQELFVLPDADRPGRDHAERIALSAYESNDGPLQVKVLHLPGLADGEDAFDWLRSHQPGELQLLASGAAYWAPGATQRARAQHRRELTRIRVERHRAKRKAERLRPDGRSGRNVCNAVTR